MHIIYGYRSKLNGKWKVGCTLQSQREQRHFVHTRARSKCRLFDNYLKARFKEGKTFDDVFEYFQLRVFVCSRRDAERWEDIYTARYDAIHPNGFGLKSGQYRGRASAETRRLMSVNGKGKKMPPRSEEHIAKLNQCQKGRKASAESRERMRIAQTGKKQSKETIEKRVSKTRGQKRPKQSAAMKGRKITWGDKISQNRKGKGMKNQNAVKETLTLPMDVP